jgi:hypothetical protein
MKNQPHVMKFLLKRSSAAISTRVIEQMAIMLPGDEGDRLNTSYMRWPEGIPESQPRLKKPGL